MAVVLAGKAVVTPTGTKCAPTCRDVTRSMLALPGPGPPDTGVSLAAAVALGAAGGVAVGGAMVAVGGMAVAVVGGVVGDAACSAVALGTAACPVVAVGTAAVADAG